MKIKKKLLKIIHRCFPALLYQKRFYSQDGEDMLIQAYYEAKKHYKGFYVDIGAHHPYRFSNTAYFYKKGWRGINIEPTPTLFPAFKRHRKHDINLNIGITLSPATLQFYIFNDPALNTFSEQIAQERHANDDKYKIISTIEVKTTTLKDILDAHLVDGQRIDFLTIDVEGFDFEVLKSNDWNKYLPKFILVECDIEVENIKEDKIHQFLQTQNYRMIGRTLRTSLFKYN